MRELARDGALAGLLEIAGVISAELGFTALLKLLAQKAATICGADRCSIYLLRDGILQPAMSQYASGLPNPTMWRALKSFGPVHVDDFPGFARALRDDVPVVFTDPAGVVPARWVETFRIRSGLILPLVRHERRVGIIHLNNCESEREFGTADVEVGRAIAVQLALLIDNARLVEETRARLRETETLLAAGQTVNSTLDLTDVVRRISRATAHVLGADSCGIYLAGANRTLQSVAGYGAREGWLGGREGFREMVALLGDGGHPVWTDDVPNDPRCTHPLFRRFPLRSLLVAPMAAKAEVVGVLLCAWEERPRRFSESELRVVEGLAAQAAIGIVNARLYAKSEELAVNRERVRVAQDLHDRLSQTVFSLGLKLEWCRHHTTDTPELHTALEDVRGQAQSIMSQMRQVIYELSPEISPALDFAARLRELVEDFRELSGIVVAYVEPRPFPPLAPAVEEVLFKTLQEAFANVAKHAHARRVSLALTTRAGAIAFAVSDDGVGPHRGFAVGQGAGHGVRQMIERIESAGGRIEFGRNVPTGFAVRGWVPRSTEPRPASPEAPC